MPQATMEMPTMPRAVPRREAEVLPQLSPAPANVRLLSLDALRGLTMFWIIGGSDVLLALVTCLSSSAAVVDTVKRQLDHPRWEGFVAWDAIMPIFLFVVGAAMSLALVKRVEQGQPLGPTYWRIARRVAVLWILGIVVQHLRYHARWPELEVFSKPELYSNTLQAIAVGYLVTSLALLHLSIRGQIVLFFVLLLGYWALLAFVPFAGYPAGTLEQTANFALLCRSVDFRRFSPRPLFHLDAYQPWLRRLGAHGRIGRPYPEEPAAHGTQASGIVVARLGVPGKWVGVELLAPAEPSPVDQFDDPLGRRLEFPAGGLVSCGGRRGKDQPVGISLSRPRRQRLDGVCPRYRRRSDHPRGGGETDWPIPGLLRRPAQFVARGWIAVVDCVVSLPQTHTTSGVGCTSVCPPDAMKVGLSPLS